MPTLLLADDSTTIQRVVGLTFAEQGINVVAVSDGQQAAEALRTQPIDVALISVTLPKIDGFELLRVIRAQPDGREIPALLLAGAFDELDAVRVRDSGAAGLLTKPFEPTVVIKRVKELLGIKKEGGEGGGVPAAGRLVTSPEGPPTAATANSSPPVEGAPSADYFEQLDAAFDNLDAQLSGRPAPAGRATNPPPKPIPAAIDPNRRPAAVQERSDFEFPALPPRAASPHPVFEADDQWFDRTDRSAAGGSPAEPGAGHRGHNVAAEMNVAEELAAFAGNTRAPQSQATYASPPVSLSLPSDPAPDESSVDRFARNAPSPHAGQFAASFSAPVSPVTATEPTAFAQPAAAAHGDAVAPASPMAPWSSTAAPTAPAPVAPVAPVAPAPVAPAPVAAAPVAPAPIAPSAPFAPSAPGVSGPPTPVAPSFDHADAFAALLAEEQGEPPPPVLDTFAPPTAAAPASPPVLEISDEMIDALATRVSDRVVDRVADRVSERVAERVSERLVAAAGAQIADRVAERLLQSTFGAELHRTVIEVSERLVREEIARLRAAAEAKGSAE